MFLKNQFLIVNGHLSHCFLGRISARVPDNGDLPLVGQDRWILHARVGVIRMRNAQPDDRPQRLALPVKVILGHGGQLGALPRSGGEAAVKVGVDLAHQVSQLITHQLIRIYERGGDTHIHNNGQLLSQFFFLDLQPI